MAQFELSAQKYKNGRRPFTAILYELQPPDCVDTENEVGTKYNKNGITFLEEYCAPQLESIKDMSVTVEFLDEDRTQIYGHGLTGKTEDGMPTFNDSVVVGHFIEGYITDATIDNEKKRVVCGKGYLDEMRYSKFIAELEENLNNGVSVDGSIEIYRPEGSDSIIYKYGWKEKGRIPTSFVHSGWAFVLNAADPTSTLVELNQKNQSKGEEKEMEFNVDEIKSVIQTTITELNNDKKVYEDRITELNSEIAARDDKIKECESTIEGKDAEINTLTATVEQVQKALDDLKKEQEGMWEERETLEKELGKLRAEKRIAEMNEAISTYTEEEQKFAESEINSFKENPLEGDIDAITSKICVGIVAKQKAEAKVVETNSKEDEVKVDDIFSEMCSEEFNSEEDINIF